MNRAWQQRPEGPASVMPLVLQEMALLHGSSNTSSALLAVQSPAAAARTKSIDGNACCEIEVFLSIGVIHAGAFAVGEHNVGAGVGLQDVPAGIWVSGSTGGQGGRSGMGSVWFRRPGGQAAARTAAAAAGVASQRRRPHPRPATPAGRQAHFFSSSTISRVNSSA